MLHQPINTVTGENEYTTTSTYIYKLPDWFIRETDMTASGGKPCLVIPIGTVTDGASVPWWLWSILRLRPDGLIRAAALTHDPLYGQRGWVYGESSTKRAYFKNVEPESWHLSRKLVDRLFLHIMLEAGMKRRRAWRAYLGVRWFAKLHKRWSV